MSEYRWWRKFRGGYWVYWHFINWQRVSREKFEQIKRERPQGPEWSMENWT